MRILTINAEDWYNGYISPQDRDWGRFEYRVEKWLIPMLDELDKRKIRAVVFCTGWLADNHPEIIRETARRGHEIGCNGYWHIEPNTMTREDFDKDQPRWEGLTVKDRFLGNVGLKGAYEKWVRVLGDMVNVNV